MNLISTLNSGLAAAANGWAEIYVRGTSTRAQVFYDFEASTSDSSGDNIALDAYGAVEVYVNQLVDIVAKSSDGSIVRSWTDGYSSPNVEVISPAFTGNDYVSGAAAVNEPTTLQAVLDLWGTNAGAPDWKVLIGGVATTPADAFGATTGLVFNVKSPQFGATGNGVTNDQTAIQAALAAAIANGGGVVFFPKGTYRISTAMEWDHRVSLAGVGAGVSVISTDSSSNARIVQWTSGTAQQAPLRVSGLSFASSQSNSGEELYSSVAVNLVCEGCVFGATTTAIGTLANLGGATQAVFRDCRFLVNGASNTSATWSTSAYVTMDRCRFLTTGTAYSGSLLKVNGTHDVVKSCTFDVSTLTSGTFYAIEQLSATNSLDAEGCSFITQYQSYDYYFKLLQDSKVYVSGCNFQGGSSGSWYTTTGPLSPNSSLQLMGNLRVDSGLSAFTVPDALRVATYRLTGAVPTITLPNELVPGQELTIIIENQSGGTYGSNVTWSGGTAYGPAADTKAPNGSAVFSNWLAVALSSASTQWVMISAKYGSA